MIHGPGGKQLIEDARKPAIYDAAIMDRLLSDPYIKEDYEEVKDDPLSLQIMKNLLVNWGIYAKYKAKLELADRSGIDTSEVEK